MASPTITITQPGPQIHDPHLRAIFAPGESSRSGSTPSAVTNNVTTGHPDAELVAAWDAFCDAWRRQLALAKTDPEGSRKAQADLIQSMRLIQSTQVATIDGILVKVRLLAHFKVIELRSPFVLDDPTQPIYGRIYGSLESTSSRLILDLVRDLHALTVGRPVLLNPVEAV
ncbi:hypothetical protein GAY28_05890 [Azospirillum brasilense]|nr:hypothetical protein [Azospirillum brasilense]